MSDNNFIGSLLAPKPNFNGNIQGAGAHIAEAPEKKNPYSNENLPGGIFTAHQPLA